MAETSLCNGPLSSPRQHNCLPKFRNGLAIPYLLCISGRKEIVRRWEVLVQLQSLLELFDSRVVVASVVKGQSQFKVDGEREWFQFHCTFSLYKRFIAVAHYR